MWIRVLAGGVLTAIGLAVFVFLAVALYTRDAWGEQTFLGLGIPVTLLTPLVGAGLVLLGVWLAAPNLIRRPK